MPHLQCAWKSCFLICVRDTVYHSAVQYVSTVFTRTVQTALLGLDTKTFAAELAFVGLDVEDVS